MPCRHTPSAYQLECLCRTGLGPNEVDVKDLQSLPNASKKDGAVPAIQKVANPPKKKEVSLCACTVTCLEAKHVVFCSHLESSFLSVLPKLLPQIGSVQTVHNILTGPL